MNDVLCIYYISISEKSTFSRGT